METKLCGNCLEEIEGGMYIERNNKNIHFCSEDCFEEFNKKDKK